MFESKNISILYIDPDKELKKKTVLFLRKNGLHVFETESVMNAFDIFRTNKIDIIFIHIQEPVEIGCELIEYLRDKNILTPVIVTANHTTKELLLKVINLEITRFLHIPYSNKKLAAALKVAVKKVLFCHPLAFTELNNGFSYDPINKLINRPDKTTVNLSKKEYMLVEILLQNKQQVLSYEAIENHVWEGKIMSIDALRTLIRSIRQKTYPALIENYNGLGYKVDL